MSKLIKDMPAAKYHATDAISVSGLKEILRSPAHYKWKYLDGHQKETAALEFGRLFHALVLEPETVDAEYAVAPACDRRTKEGKALYEEFYHANKSKCIVRHEDMTLAKAMAKAILDNAAAEIVLTGKGHAEVSAFWQQGEGEYAVPARCRMDWLRSDGLIVDLKTTTDASPDGFGRHAYNYGYHMQAWWYQQAYIATHGKQPEGFVFIAVEKEAPHCVGVYVASPEMLALGQKDCEAALGKYRESRRANKWPGYPEQIEILNLPKWAENRIEQGA